MKSGNKNMYSGYLTIIAWYEYCTKTNNALQKWGERAYDWSDSG